MIPRAQHEEEQAARVRQWEQVSEQFWQLERQVRALGPRTARTPAQQRQAEHLMRQMERQVKALRRLKEQARQHMARVRQEMAALEVELESLPAGDGEHRRAALVHLASLAETLKNLSK